MLTGGPVQIAYCVPDVEEAALDWTERFGAGPFFVRHHIPVEDVLVNGRPGSFDHSSAYGQWGSLMVELVAVHDPPELAATGLHHQAYFVTSFDAAAEALASNGLPSVMSAAAGSTRFAFHDARPTLGHLIEIYEPSDGLLGFYAMVADAASGWDGSDPVRVIG